MIVQCKIIAKNVSLLCQFKLADICTLTHSVLVDSMSTKSLYTGVLYCYSLNRQDYLLLSQQCGSANLLFPFVSCSGINPMSCAFTQDMGMKMHNIQWVILY